MDFSKTWIIATREFRSYFNGPIAYIVTALFLGLLGIFFWPPFFLFGKASVREMFQLVSMFLFVIAPAITMGSVAEEKHRGTLEILITMPVRDADVIVGKFLGALGLFLAMLVATLSYPIAVSSLGNLDWGPVWTGYLGLILEGGAMLAIGVLASSWTRDQLTGFFLGTAMCFGLWIVDRFVPFLPAAAASVVEWMSFDYHFRSMARGVIDTRNVAFFLTVIVLCLGLAFRSLESRRWR